MVTALITGQPSEFKTAIECLLSPIRYVGLNFWICNFKKTGDDPVYPVHPCFALSGISPGFFFILKQRIQVENFSTGYTILANIVF
jgi:hypothetical protein